MSTFAGMGDTDVPGYDNAERLVVEVRDEKDGTWHQVRQFEQTWTIIETVKRWWIFRWTTRRCSELSPTRDQLYKDAVAFAAGQPDAERTRIVRYKIGYYIDIGCPFWGRRSVIWKNGVWLL